jgi:predicted ester cyclase
MAAARLPAITFSFARQIMRKVMLTSAALAAAQASAAPIDDAAARRLARPQELIIAAGMTPVSRKALLDPVDAFYGFWENGSPALLARAISPHFIDHTLPPGRPQGPTGPAIASKAFLAAVPDLRMTVLQRLVVNDRVVSHLRFVGHFTGQFQDVEGRGQPVDFIATDIVRVKAGRITDNWHLEDNLTFLNQIGFVHSH